MCIDPVSKVHHVVPASTVSKNLLRSLLSIEHIGTWGNVDKPFR